MSADPSFFVGPAVVAGLGVAVAVPVLGAVAVAAVFGAVAVVAGFFVLEGGVA